MAVKEYSGSESAASPLSENLNNYSVSKLLAYIEEIGVDIEQEPDLNSVSRKVVNLLGHVQIPPNNMPSFRENIAKVDEFLETLSKLSNGLAMEACMRELYELIMNNDRPSPAAGIVLHRIQASSIPEATRWFLSSSDYTSDAQIVRGVTTLIVWISSSHLINNLTQWIIGILTGLRDMRKFELLMCIAENNIDLLLRYGAIPVFAKYVWPIVLHMLASIRHSPNIYNRILKLYAMNPAHLPKDALLAKQLENTMAALMVVFPETAHTEKVRRMLRPSGDYMDTLVVAPWHDQPTAPVTVRRRYNTPVGLVNLGNTCYMNSVLQALMLSKQFTRDLLMADVRTHLFQNMQRLMAQLLHTIRPDVAPEAVLHSARPPGFHLGHEQDSSEFLGHLIDQLHEQEKSQICVLIDANAAAVAADNNRMEITAADDEKTDKTTTTTTATPVSASSAKRTADMLNLRDESSTNGTSPTQPPTPHQLKLEQQRKQLQQLLPAQTTVIQKSFGGIFSITYKCLECQGESSHFDSFRDLHLSFPDPESNATHSVQELLDLFCTPERLDADNKYYCDPCEKLCVAERYINIVGAPFGLILTLKHFKYDQRYNQRAKLMHKVNLEEYITVPLYTGDDFAQRRMLHYRLYAAVVHSGVSMETGHYFTYGTDGGRNPEGTCFRFDDSYVCRTNVTELDELQPPQTPYILFYQLVEDPANERRREQQQQQQRPNHQQQQLSPRKSPKLDDSSSASSPISSLDSPPSTPPPPSMTPMAPSTSQSSKAAGAVIAPTSPNSLMAVACHEYPELNDLPPGLRDFVTHDNYTYDIDARQLVDAEVRARNEQNRNDTLQRRNDDDDDEDSNGNGNGNGGGSSNFMPSYNRNIC